jgi:hypothetical protein
LWRQVEDLARRIIVAAKPKTPNKAKVLGSHLAHYLTWTASQFGGDPTPLAALVLEDVTFRQYEHEGQLDARPGTRATRRSEIRPALLAARPGPAPAKLPYRPVRPPYTRAEQAQHVRLARNQPTRGRRRALSAVVALGYGGGLDGHDLRWLRACDVFVRKLPDGTNATCVRVRGSRPRTVVIRAEYAPLLHEAVQLHLAERRGKTGLLLGQKPNRSNVSTVAFENAVTADGAEVAIEVARLRTTWLTALLPAPVPLAVLLQAAGLRSARPLVDLLPYAPLPDDDTATRLLQAQPGSLIQLVGGTR